jgi:hypothetical protein
MEMKEFVIVYFPFPESDMTQEAVEFGVDDEDALKAFRKRESLFRVKSVTEK